MTPLEAILVLLRCSSMDDCEVVEKAEKLVRKKCREIIDREASNIELSKPE